MKKAILRRQPNAVKETLGVLEVYDCNDKIIVSMCSLELPWLNNQVRKSCIPKGIYTVVKYLSVHHGECWRIDNVVNRNGILIHSGNFNRDTEGCILVGLYFENIDNDNAIDVGSSKMALQILNNHFDKSFELLIQ